MKAVYSAAHLAHDIRLETDLGEPVAAHEVTERAEVIRAALEADDAFDIVAPAEHGEGPILAVHEAGLVRFLESAWRELRAARPDRGYLAADTFPNQRMFEGMSEAALSGRPEPSSIAGRAGWWGFDTATPLVAGTYDAARAAVDVALTAADLVLGGERVTYGLCRPPGHHTARAMYGGFCFFNNAAIAAQSLVDSSGERVAVLDVDFHHGNGTQQIFWRRGDVLYASLHGDPVRHYPHFLGHEAETGEGAGAGANLNLPLPAGTSDGDYLTALDRALEAIAATPGSIVIVSLGFDTYERDPLGDFELTTAGYHEIGRRIAALGRRLVCLQEGGYHRPALGENARAWLRGASGLEHAPLRRLEGRGRSDG